MNLFPTQFFRINFIPFALILFSIFGCKRDPSPKDTTMPINYGYTVAIHSPSENSSYSLGDTLPISVRFSSTTGEIVHNIKVEIYNKSLANISLYSVQSHQHVPNFYNYSENFVLKDTSKIQTGETWILKASMWSHEINTDTISLKKEFIIRS
jgi:hypothetical protein